MSATLAPYEINPPHRAKRGSDEMVGNRWRAAAAAIASRWAVSKPFGRIAKPVFSSPAKPSIAPAIRSEGRTRWSAIDGAPRRQRSRQDGRYRSRLAESPSRSSVRLRSPRSHRQSDLRVGRDGRQSMARRGGSDRVKMGGIEAVWQNRQAGLQFACEALDRTGNQI